MTFPIDATVPFGTNDPADDVTPMRINYANIKGYLTVDHVAPGAVGDGFHKQVTFPASNVPALPVSPAAILYTGTAANGLGPPASLSTQQIFRNASGIFPISCIRAMARVDGGGAILSTSYNVDQVTPGTTGKFTIDLTSGAVANDQYGIIVTSIGNSTFTVGAVCGYTVLSAAQFELNFIALSGINSTATRVGTNPTSFSFIVIQF